MSKRRIAHNECCCNFCAKKAWCQKNPNKGRQCCNARQKSVECLTLIQQRWCTLCPLFVGKTSEFGPHEPPLPGMDGGLPKALSGAEGKAEGRGLADAVAGRSVEDPKTETASPLPREPLPPSFQAAGDEEVDG